MKNVIQLTYRINWCKLDKVKFIRRNRKRKIMRNPWKILDHNQTHAFVAFSESRSIICWLQPAVSFHPIYAKLKETRDGAVDRVLSYRRDQTKATHCR